MRLLNTKQLLTHFGFMLAMGGPRMFTYFLKAFPILMLAGISSDDLEEWLSKARKGIGETAVRATRGIPGLLGVDVTAAVTPTLPSSLTEILGLTINDMLKVAQLIPGINLGYGVQDVGEFVKNSMPILGWTIGMVESLASNMGDKQIKDMDGELS